MSVLNQQALKRPALRKETVPMPALGGEVIVREMILDEKLLNTAMQATERQPLPGETNEEARSRAGVSIVSRVLAWCVIHEDGELLMSRQQWREFGGANLQEALDAFNVALRLSGFDMKEVERTSSPAGEALCLHLGRCAGLHRRRVGFPHGRLGVRRVAMHVRERTTASFHCAGPACPAASRDLHRSGEAAGGRENTLGRELHGERLDDLQEKTGIAVEKLSELRYAVEATGTLFEALSGGVDRLSKVMAEAAGGGKKAAATFEALGVEVDANGNTAIWLPPKACTPSNGAASRLTARRSRPGRAVVVVGFRPSAGSRAPTPAHKINAGSGVIRSLRLTRGKRLAVARRRLQGPFLSGFDGITLTRSSQLEETWRD